MYEDPLVNTAVTLRNSHILRIKERDRNISLYIRDVLDEHFLDETTIKNEIKRLKNILKKVKNEQKMNKNDTFLGKKLTKPEENFFKNAKKIIEKDNSFFKGQQNLYRNTFGKSISSERFLRILDKIDLDEKKEKK